MYNINSNDIKLENYKCSYDTLIVSYKWRHHNHAHIMYKIMGMKTSKCNAGHAGNITQVTLKMSRRLRWKCNAGHAGNALRFLLNCCNLS